MNALIGFLIALAIGLTGIGGGSFTVPALVLIVGLPASASVGTAFVYAGVMRLIASPFYLGGKHIHWRYLWLLIQGAVPGLLIGTYLLRKLSGPSNMPVVVILLGLLLTASSSVTFLPWVQNQSFARKNSSWLPVARSAHRHRIRFLVSGRGRARHRAAAQLFGDDAAGGGRHRSAVRARARGNRQRVSVEIRRDKHATCSLSCWPAAFPAL